MANYGYGYPRTPLTGFALFKRTLLNSLKTSAQVFGITLVVMLFIIAIAAPFLWWGSIAYVGWHFISKVW